jgi:hypothetical protein
MDTFAGRGLRIPEEVAVIVIDKDAQRTAELAPVPLTAVVPDFWQQGYEAARLVHRMIEGEQLGNHVVQVAPLGLVRSAAIPQSTISAPPSSARRVRPRASTEENTGEWTADVGSGRSLSGITCRRLPASAR